MDKFISFLNGKKTMLSAVITMALVGLYSLGGINTQVFEAAVVFFGALGLLSLRLAVKKAEK